MCPKEKYTNSLFYIVAGILTVFGASLFLYQKRKERIHQLNKSLEDYTNSPWIGFDKVGQDFKTTGDNMRKALKDYEKQSVQF